MIFKIVFLFLLYSHASFASIRAVATTTDVAWLLYRIGGEHVEVKTLARSGDNYHYLDARPDFILAVNRADIVCRVGADLEIGWMPKILQRAANKKVMSGSNGDCELSRSISLNDKPKGAIDRSMGDVHAAGNPHFWLSPTEMANAAMEVESRLSAVSPGQKEEFSKNRATLVSELKALEANLKEKFKPLAGKLAYEYHKDFSYFFSAYGMKSGGSIEAIPGVSPSAARLAEVALRAKQNNAAFALAAEYHPKSTMAKFREISGVPVIFVPTSLSDPKDKDAYKKWQENMARLILETNK